MELVTYSTALSLLQCVGTSFPSHMIILLSSLILHCCSSYWTWLPQKLWAVSGFLVYENTIGNHKWVQKVYGDDAVNCSSVGHWVKQITSAEGGWANLCDCCCSWKPHSAWTDAGIEKMSDIMPGRCCRRNGTLTGCWWSKHVHISETVGLNNSLH
jgi:hypothetical protein